MRAQFSRTALCGGCACILALAIGAPLNAGRAGGYLAEVGPTPLRYQGAKARARTVQLPPLPTEDTPVSTNAPELNAGPTPVPPTTPLVSSSPLPVGLLPATTATNLSNATGSTNSGATATERPAESEPDRTSANDLLGITPQMFVEYFKPAENSTNAPGASVYVPVGFTPPAPVTVPSKATYNSQ